MKKILFAAAAAAFLAGTAFSQAVNPPRKAPELAFTLPGQGEKLLSQYRGKVVGLEFILTTCPHCQNAAHFMTGFQQKYGVQGLDALDLAINGLDENRTPEQANELVQAFQLNFQVGFPVGWVKRDAMSEFMNFSLMDRTVVPQIVLIDRKGFVRFQTTATNDPTLAPDQDLRRPEVLEKHIQELLSERNTVAHHATNKLVAKRAS